MDARGAKIVTSACLQNLAGKMGHEWKDVGRRLGLEDTDLQYLTRDGNYEGQENINYGMLATWKKKAADKATYKVLAKALDKAGRLDLAQELLNGKFDDDMDNTNMHARGSKIVTSACLQNLAGKMGHEWKDVGRRLGLEDTDLHYLTRDGNYEGQENINYGMLATWKKKAADKATYKVLANALDKAGRLDLAQQLLNGKFDDDMASDNIPEVSESISTTIGLGAVGRYVQTAPLADTSEVSESSPTQSTDPGAVGNDAQIPRGSTRVPHYEMRSKPLGKCLILTYDNFSDNEVPDKKKSRPGNAVDEKNLKEVFTKLGFDVSCKTNLNKDDTMEKIQKMAKKCYDSFVLFVCSHGNEKAFTTSDKNEINIQDVITPFKVENCQGFASKPKMFFFNSCRGTAEEMMSEVYSMEPQRDSTGVGVAANLSYYRPNEADFCVVLSTVPGYVAWRQPTKGTVFVQDLCTSLENNFKTHHLLDILTMTIDTMLHKFAVKRAATGEIQTKCQVPTLISTLSKAVYFVDE